MKKWFIVYLLVVTGLTVLYLYKTGYWEKPVPPEIDYVKMVDTGAVGSD